MINILKKINIPGMIILVTILLIIQFGVGLFISPVVSSFVIDKINEATGSKISIEKASLWPVTFSLSLKKVKIFDPDNPGERLIALEKASLRISPWGILSRRIVFSKISVKGADINLEGEPDGSFNIEKALPSGEAQKGAPSIFDKFRTKKDWFTRIYELVKKRGSKNALQESKDSRKIKKEIKPLPRGKLIEFKRETDDYVFMVESLVASDSTVNITSGSEKVKIQNADLWIKKLRVDPEKGARFDGIGAKGSVYKNEEFSGNFALDFRSKFTKNRSVITLNASTRGMDLAAVRFIYEDSLPVNIEQGRLDLNSDTKIINENLNSDNSITLRGQSTSPKGGQGALGFMPLPILCEALNQADPAKFRFKITGTMDNPKMEGFQQALQALLKPYIANIGEKAKAEGVKTLQESLGSIFKKKE